MTPRWILCACLALAVVSRSRADAGGYVLVKNAKNPTPSLTRDEAKNVFNGHTKEWGNGEAVILVIGSEDSPAMTWLASTLFGVSAKTFLAKLKQDVFKGDVRHPVSADDDAKTVKRIEAGPGLVGFVSDDGAKALPPDVAVVPVR